jgi:ribosomal protein L13
MTKSELIALCKKENPKMISVINGEEIELTGADYEAACEQWAEMRLQQIAYEAEQETLKQAEAASKAAAEAKLSALGLEPDDLKALGF